MSRSVRQAVLLFLYEHAGRHGVTASEIGAAVWPDRVIRGGRGVSSNGGGDYAAQMLLGRLKKAGLVEYASSLMPGAGTTRWRLSVRGLHEIQEPPRKTKRGGAIVSGTDPCCCGDAPEAHGRDPKYPGSTACTACDDCLAYEADPEVA